MAAYISFQPSDYYSTTVYSAGTAPLANTGVGFSADITWIKSSTYVDNPNLFDTVRGATKYLYPNKAWIEDTSVQSLISWQADGFTVGTNNDVNRAAQTFASWNWKAGTTSGITTNGSTTITPAAYSFSTTAGISILKYEGNGTSDAKLAHGLGVAPQQIILKRYENNTEPWGGYNIGVGGYLDPEDYGKALNTDGAKDNDASYWNDTKPDSVNITLGNGGRTNESGEDFIAYAFAPVKGFSKFGCYRGSANANGPFIYCGFRPAFIMIKSDDSSTNWAIFDNKRSLYTGNDYAIQLWANDTAVPGTDQTMEIMSNGFRISRTNTYSNASGAVITYMAFAEFPIVSSNNIPTVAR